jgi:prepilin-type N-terminal cleavage/methylation domain-containing protein
MQPPARQAGFTLIELMIAILISSIAIAAGLGIAFSIMNNYHDHAGTLRVDSKARIVLDMIASSVRSSSPGLVTGRIWNPCTGTEVDTIVHTNSVTGPDRLDLIHAAGGAVASLTSAQDISSSTLTVDDNSMFEKDLWTPAVVVDAITSKGHLVDIQAATGDPSTSLDVRPPGDCTVAGAGDPNYSAASFVIRAVKVSYFIDEATYSVPYLMIDPDGDGAEVAQPVAEGIEDLQVAFGVDLDDSGQLVDAANSTDEWFRNDPADAATPALTGGLWRAARITIVSRSTVELTDQPLSTRPQVEDRAAASTADPFKRRALSTTIELRNLGGG